MAGRTDVTEWKMAEIARLRERVAELLEYIAGLERESASLRARLAELEQELRLQKEAGHQQWELTQEAEAALAAERDAAEARVAEMDARCAELEKQVLGHEAGLSYQMGKSFMRSQLGG